MNSSSSPFTSPWKNLRTNVLAPFDPATPISLSDPYWIEEPDPGVDNHGYSESPFDMDALDATRVYFSKYAAGKGTYSGNTMSISSVANDTLYLSLGVSMGNKVIGASVSGSYDKSIQEAGSVDKSTRRISYQAGAIRMDRTPQLSKSARLLLAEAEAEAGEAVGHAFRAKYGDFYVSGLVIGGEAAVTVMQDAERKATVERLKAKAEGHFLCFSAETTIAEKDIQSSSTSEEFGVVAFDSLTSHGCNMTVKNGQGLQLSDARRLALMFDGFIETMPTRVQERMKRWPQLFSHGSTLSAKECKALMLSGLVTHVVLTPWTIHREIRPLVVEASEGGYLTC